MCNVNINKKLTKSDMAYLIGLKCAYNVVSISWDKFSRDEVVKEYNKYYSK